MSDEIANLLNKVKSVEESMNEIILMVVKKNEREVLRLNVDEQLYKGVNSMGEKIKPRYSSATVKRKKKKGQPFNRVTLKDEGDFYDGFFVEYGVDEFSLQGDDKKTRYLIKRYGKEIFGLTDKSLSDLIEMMEEDFIKIVKVKILE